MGCSYYRNYGVAAYFKNGAYITEKYNQDDVYGYHFNYDEDLSGDFERNEEKWMNDEYSNKIIFNDCEWLIDNQSQINFYINTIKPIYENKYNSLSTRNGDKIDDDCPRNFDTDLIKLVKYTYISKRW